MQSWQSRQRQPQMAAIWQFTVKGGANCQPTKRMISHRRLFKAVICRYIGLLWPTMQVRSLVSSSTGSEISSLPSSHGSDSEDTIILLHLFQFIIPYPLGIWEESASSATSWSFKGSCSYRMVTYIQHTTLTTGLPLKTDAVALSYTSLPRTEVNGVLYS